VIASIVWFLAQAEGEAEPVNDAKDLYPHWQELLVGALAFAVLFFFVWKWVLPRVNALLDERRDKIQGDLERAEQTRTQADQELADYRQQLANARQESNAIIEEARKTADQLRAEIQARAEREAAATVAKAQEEGAFRTDVTPRFAALLLACWILTAKLERSMRGIWKFSTVAYVGDDEVTSAEMMVAPETNKTAAKA